MPKWIPALVIVLILVGAGAFAFSRMSSSPDAKIEGPMWVTPTVLPLDELRGRIAHIQTAKGEIVIELFDETAPLTVSNFIYLARRGYFDGLTFHRREEGFVIQGGDPSGNGTGGPGYRFADELNDSYTYERGIVAMANAGPNTNGSQFFVMLGDTPLPKNYSVFGRVISGMEAVDAIKVGDKMDTVTIEKK